jgi:hypothetical protein
MKCTEMVELISAQIDNELSPAEADLLNGHLQTCPRCQTLKQRMQQINSGLSKLPEVEPPSLRPRSLPKAPVQGLRFRRPLALAASLAASIALYWFWPRTQPITLYLAEGSQLSSAAPQEAQMAIQTFQSQPLYGKGGELQFELLIDSQSKPCKDLQLEIAYDYDGDGKADRTELYRPFSTDSQKGWERYSQTIGLQSSQGQVQDFKGGRLTAHIKNATPDLNILQGKSRLILGG